MGTLSVAHLDCLVPQEARPARLRFPGANAPFQPPPGLDRDRLVPGARQRLWLQPRRVVCPALREKTVRAGLRRCPAGAGHARGLCGVRDCAMRKLRRLRLRKLFAVPGPGQLVRPASGRARRRPIADVWCLHEQRPHTLPFLRRYRDTAGRILRTSLRPTKLAPLWQREGCESAS
jgi:hypothetical protein